MNTRMFRVAVAMILGLGLAGCATTDHQRGGDADLFGCEQIPFSEPVPGPTDPLQDRKGVPDPEAHPHHLRSDHSHRRSP